MTPPDEYIEHQHRRFRRRLNRWAHENPALLDALIQRWAQRAIRRQRMPRTIDPREGRNHERKSTQTLHVTTQAPRTR